MREEFAKQLELLKQKIKEMGELLVCQIEGAMESYVNKDKELAQTIIGTDKEVNDREKEIESLCMRLLLLQQPVATDLTKVSSGFKMITDMERIGDQAADIAETTIDLRGASIAELDKIIMEMSGEVVRMLEHTLSAFAHSDIEMARAVVEHDDVVDELFVKLKDSAADVLQEKSEISHAAIDYLMIGKHLEKIGDYTVNIATRV